MAAPLRCVTADTQADRWHRFAKLKSHQQGVALDLLGCPPAWAPMLQVLSSTDPALAPTALFDLVQRNARFLPEAVATRLWQWLAPWAARRGCACPALFGKPTKAHQECATALAVEIKGELSHAEEHWTDAVQLLASSADTRDRLRAAMVLRHMAGMKEHGSREGLLDKAGAGYLLRSLEFDASDCDVHVQLVANFRRKGDLKKARERLEAGLALFPESVALLTEAVETALASSAFKKAVTTGRRLLELDPLNRKVRALLGNAHLSHAGKHITAEKLGPAKKEIEEARAWLDGTHDQGRLLLLQAWTEPAGSDERLRLARQAVTAWGGGLGAGWRLVREAQGLFPNFQINSAKWLLDEAGIDASQALTPTDVLALVQVLEHESPIERKGADPFVAWRKALLELAAQPWFDEAATMRICEALSRHKEHNLLEKFANSARKRWPDRPLFVYHAVAARFGKRGEILSERDFDDLDEAQQRAHKGKDFKLDARIQALFDADDPFPDDDYDDADPANGMPELDPQVFREMLEISIQMDGGKQFMQKARLEMGDEILSAVEKAFGGNKKLVLNHLIDMVVTHVTGMNDEPFPLPAAKPKKRPSTRPKINPSAPAKGQGGLFDE